jgi:GAF domain-containing protein
MATVSHLKEDPIGLLLEASASLLESPELKEVLPKILKLAEILLKADAYAVWRLRPGENEWKILHSRGLSEAYSKQRITGNPTSYQFNKPFIVEDAETTTLVVDRKRLYSDDGIKSLIAFPLSTPEGGTGTVSFYFRKKTKFPEEFVRTSQLLANIAAAAINTSEVYEREKELRLAAEISESRAKFLSDASALLASSLDYNTTLNRFARLAVPQIADWCVVYVLQENGELDRTAVAHIDPQKVLLAEEFNKKYPPDMSRNDGVAQVIKEGKSQFVGVVTPELLQAGARDPEHLRMIQQLGMHSVLIVPLKSRDEVLGCLTLVNAESKRAFDVADEELAKTLASRAAIAVDNARLYDRLRRTSAEAQIGQEQLRLTQHVAKICSWTFDIDQQEFSFGSDISEICGLRLAGGRVSRDAFLDQLFYSADREFMSRALASMGKGRKEFNTEFRIRDAKGSTKLLSMRGQLFFNQGQASVLGLLIDVTEAAKLQEPTLPKSPPRLETKTKPHKKGAKVRKSR